MQQLPTQTAGVPRGLLKLGLSSSGRDGYLYVPPDYHVQRPSPLMLCLHAAGKGGLDGLAPLLPFAEALGALAGAQAPAAHTCGGNLACSVHLYAQHPWCLERGQARMAPACQAGRLTSLGPLAHNKDAQRTPTCARGHEHWARCRLAGRSPGPKAYSLPQACYCWPQTPAWPPGTI